MRTGKQATGHGLEVAKMVHNGGGTAGHYRQGAVSGHLATSAPGLGLRTLSKEAGELADSYLQARGIERGGPDVEDILEYVCRGN